ncbi:AAA domain-containing protein, partial [Alphaproteobacteria bacterium]|nr:AAA domain-containing protein [Alphaproteobacteria bacterium]
SPDAGNGIGKPSTYTGMSLLHHETEKKAGHKSPRFLLDKAGDALLELMPCWTMPPLNIAKYLKSDFQKFDLCIIDEASQMIPGFALGALLRSKQCIIVGDVNQMPPDNTFTTNLNSVDQDEDLAMPEESILEIANVTFKPRRRLKWHYRSEDSSLIAFSNRYVYEDELILFPSSSENSKINDMGVSLVKLDGLYKSSINILEATKIVEYATNFMKKHPKRSFGIVAMNLQQTDHILSLIDTAQNTLKHVRDYINYWDKINEGLERFIVKNVASIQGDERDTILISTVYGPETTGGPVAKRFGPVNGNSGKRRLNVLFSRAKKQLVTFTSMKPSDLKVDKAKNEGVFLLGKWLEYSQTRVIDAGEQTNKKPDSDFEIYVMEQIEKLGYQAIPQVGVAGYFIDIGVKHPDWEYGYIMGVECDGRQYHSSLSARDRDRLRQNVLENLGWSFHRIWSTDWFNTRDQEINRLKKRLDEKLEDLKASKNNETKTSIEDLNIELRKEEISNLLPQITSEQDVIKSNINDKSQEITKEKFNAELEKAKNLKGTPEYNDEVFKIFDNITEMIEEQKTKSDSVTNSKFIEIQDQVTLEYMDGDKSIFQFIISEKENNLENGIINQNMPIAKAVLEQELGEEIDVLVGVRRRKAIIKEIKKQFEK